MKRNLELKQVGKSVMSILLSLRSTRVKADT